jgi:hypothetical protein
VAAVGSGMTCNLWAVQVTPRPEAPQIAARLPPPARSDILGGMETIRDRIERTPRRLARVMDLGIAVMFGAGQAWL